MVPALVPATAAAKGVLRAAATWHQTIANKAKTLIDAFRKALILRIRLLPSRKHRCDRTRRWSKSFAFFGGPQRFPRRFSLSLIIPPKSATGRISNGPTF